MKTSIKDFCIKLFLVALAGILVLHLTSFISAFKSIIKVLEPLFIGVVFSLILKLPLDFLERKIFVKLKNIKLRRFICLSISILFLIGLIALILGLAIPAGIKSVQLFIIQIQSGSAFEELAQSNAFFSQFLSYFEKLLDYFIANFKNHIPQMVTIAQNTFKLFFNIFIGIFIAIMLLINHDKLAGQSKKVLLHFVKRPKLVTFVKVSDIAITKFSRYLAGQLVEAVILGFACYLCMLALSLPYPSLVSIIVGFCNLIPIVGSYIGGGFSALIIFALSPIKSLIFIIFVLILQQIEAFTTYPIVVGKHVGLNSFWIIVSVIVWGGIFGFWGVFLGVPLTAFLQELCRLYFKECSKTEPITLQKDIIKH